MEQAREQAKQAAQAFQANGPEFLQNIGTHLAAMLEQFGNLSVKLSHKGFTITRDFSLGIDTQVDVHGPETSGKCPREAAKKQEQPEAAKKQEQSEAAGKPEPEKAKEEIIIPIVVEKEEEMQPKEVIIPITIMKDDEAAPVATTSPYAEVAAEVAAAKETSTEASRTNSPTRESDGWTMVGDVEKQAAATASADLGARPKSPQKLIESVAAPLHPGIKPCFIFCY